MTWGQAFDALVAGHSIRLKSWPEKLVLRFQPKTEIIHQPYFYMTCQYGRIKVQKQVMDYFSQEWEIVD